MTSGQEGAATQPRFNIVVVGLAAALISLLLLREFAGIIGPLFLALNLMITGYPVHRWLVRKGTPSWLSATVVSLMVFAVLVDGGGQPLQVEVLCASTEGYDKFARRIAMQSEYKPAVVNGAAVTSVVVHVQKFAGGAG